METVQSYVDVLIRVVVVHDPDLDPEDLVNDADYAITYQAEDGQINDTEMTEVALAGRVGENNVLIREDGKTGRTASIRHSPSVEECAIDTDPNEDGIQTKFVVKKGVVEASGLDSLPGVAACYLNPNGEGQNILVLVHNRDPKHLAEVIKDQTNGNVIVERIPSGFMRVEFTTACQIEIVEEVDDDTGRTRSETESFEVGDKTDWDVIGHPEKNGGGRDYNLLNVQFGDSSVAFGIDRSWFKELS